MVVKDRMVYVSISQADLDLAREIAKKRSEKKSTSRKFEDGYTDFDIHYFGLIAEIAWEKITAWPMDRSIIDDGDGGIDFENGGRTYQLKARNTAQYRNPDLLCRLDHANADRYILSEIDVNDLSRVIFVGWCTKEELMKNTINIKGKGERYICYRDNLRPIPKNILRSHGRKG